MKKTGEVTIRYEIKFIPKHLIQLLDLIDSGVISNTIAKEVFEEMFYTGQAPDEIVAARGLAQIADSVELETVIKQVIRDNPQAVADYRAGKQQVLKFFTGQVMRATRGLAAVKLVQELLEASLNSHLTK